MEELVIRFGCSTEGARNPTTTDIRKALDDVETWLNQREEFCIEKVSNWKHDVEDGRPVIRMLNERPYATAMTFALEGASTPLGWLVMFADTDKQDYALVSPEAGQSNFADGWCCGGPMSVRRACLVSKEMALEALRYFVEHYKRSPVHEWMNCSKIYRFD